MGWYEVVTGNNAFRVAGSCGNYVLLENHIKTPFAAKIFDARADKTVWKQEGDFHNSTIATDRDGQVVIYRTSGTLSENTPVPTGLFLAGPPVDPPVSDFEAEVLGKLDAILNLLLVKTGA